MDRLTTDKDVKEMGMYELALNSCYVKDGLARYRDFETDIDCRDLARKLMVDYGLWKGIPEHGLDANNELVDDDIFDESMLESLQYGLDTLEGLIALFYRNLWAMAYLRTKLKKYEDMEEQGRLIELPCLPNEIVYISPKGVYSEGDIFPQVIYRHIPGIVKDMQDGFIIGYTEEEVIAKLKELEDGKKENNKG